MRGGKTIFFSVSLFVCCFLSVIYVGIYQSNRIGFAYKGDRVQLSLDRIGFKVNHLCGSLTEHSRLPNWDVEMISCLEVPTLVLTSLASCRRLTQ